MWNSASITYRPASHSHDKDTFRATSVQQSKHVLNGRLLQATGLDAWASRVKCPARFVSHLHDICIYMSCL